MSEAELQKFPQHQFGQAFTTLKCDCPPYLLWLEKRLVLLQDGHNGEKRRQRDSGAAGDSLRALGLSKTGKGLFLTGGKSSKLFLGEKYKK